MSDLITLSRHILQRERKYQGASGDFTILLSHIATATKVVSRHVNRAGLADVLGKPGDTNIQGEQVAKLDAIANDLLISLLDDLPMVCALASEEEDEFRETHVGRESGHYLVCFDPLDGSSNIDVNVSIGTIFSIHRRRDVGKPATKADFFQPGSELVAAGYAVYGSSTVFVYSTGDGVDGFTLDPGIGEYLLSHPHMTLPDRARCLSVNEMNRPRWFAGTRAYVDHIVSGDDERYAQTKGRYIGSLVADFHRNLVYGGIFLYPGDRKSPGGKLRLLYEAQPLAMLIEQAGGSATDGRTPIRDIIPTELHQRVPLIIGNTTDVDTYGRFVAANGGG